MPKTSKRRANETSPVLVSSEDEVAGNRSKKERKKLRAKKKRYKTNVIHGNESEPETLGRTTSIDTLTEGSVKNVASSIAGSTRSKGPVEVSRDLEMVETTEVAKQAFDFLEEIDDLRAKSKNLHGRVSGNIKAHIGRIKEAVATLVGRVGVSGDTSFLKMRNAELTVQLNAAKQESSRRLSWLNPRE